MSIGIAETQITSGTGNTTIPQYDADPASPTGQMAWVLKSGGGGGTGTPIGLLLALTVGAAGSTPTYQFSYRTLESTTVRVLLT